MPNKLNFKGEIHQRHMLLSTVHIPFAQCTGGQRADDGGLDGSCLHGTMGIVDNYKYRQRNNVGGLCYPRRGSRCCNGDNVEFLPP